MTRLDWDGTGYKVFVKSDLASRTKERNETTNQYRPASTSLAELGEAFRHVMGGQCPQRILSPA